jgi:hypothetical protein
MRYIIALVIIGLLAGTAHAQSISYECPPDASTVDRLKCMDSDEVAQLLTPKPDKPEPVARVGQTFAPGQILPTNWAPNLVLTDVKEDGKRVWEVRPLNSCAWCGTPMTWKHAMFDRRSSAMWILATALEVTDVELAHRSPCFVAHTCREGNPLLGQTRGQAYGVIAALDVFELVGQGDVRRGDTRYHIGGWRYWWIFPTMRYAQSGIGIVSTLARWHE